MLTNSKILIVDDDTSLCDMIRYSFTKEGAEVIIASDGREGLQQFFQHLPDLVILDIHMPKIDGWEVCEKIRDLSQVPIIMLTTMSAEQHMIRGLKGGADDYIGKPFSKAELLARAEAALRRGAINNPEKKPQIYRDEHLYINLENREILVRGQRTKLSSTEFKLLEHLYLNAGTVLTYNQILTHVWGWEYADNPEYIHVYMSNLRRKIEKDSKNPFYLETEQRVGYRFNKQRMTTYR